MMTPMPDTFEFVSLVSACVGIGCSVWAIKHTYQCLRDVGIQQDVELRIKAWQRLTRHTLNFLAQTVLVYIALVAAVENPQSDTIQVVVSRIGTSLVSIILAIKVVIDRWVESGIDWQNGNGNGNGKSHD